MASASACVVVVEHLRHLDADVHVVQLGDDGHPFQEDDPPDELLGVLHLVDGPLLEVLVELFVAPVGTHLGMHHVLVDGGQLVGEQPVERGDQLVVPFHEHPLKRNRYFRPL